MAFWKKSEDPWDVDPARERERRELQEDREPPENPLDTLRDWNEGRKAKAAAKQAEWEAQPREVCPWCRKEMERGCLAGSKGVYWFPGRYTASAAWLGPGVFKESLRVDDEGGFFTYKTAWYCRDCQKLTIDAKGMRLVNAPYTWPEDAGPEGDGDDIPDALEGGEDPL